MAYDPDYVFSLDPPSSHWSDEIPTIMFILVVSIILGVTLYICSKAQEPEPLIEQIRDGKCTVVSEKVICDDKSYSHAETTKALYEASEPKSVKNTESENTDSYIIFWGWLVIATLLLIFLFLFMRRHKRRVKEFNERWNVHSGIKHFDTTNVSHVKESAKKAPDVKKLARKTPNKKHSTKKSKKFKMPITLKIFLYIILAMIVWRIPDILDILVQALK